MVFNVHVTKGDQSLVGHATQSYSGIYSPPLSDNLVFLQSLFVRSRRRVYARRACQVDRTAVQGVSAGLDRDVISRACVQVFECESDGLFLAINHVSHETEGQPVTDSTYTVSPSILQAAWTCL